MIFTPPPRFVFAADRGSSSPYDAEEMLYKTGTTIRINKWQNLSEHDSNCHGNENASVNKGIIPSIVVPDDIVIGIKRLTPHSTLPGRVLFCLALSIEH